MLDETIHWLRDTASANNTSTSSIDCAKVEEARRREYEKIEQVNRMYMAARALGFPDRIISPTSRFSDLLKKSFISFPQSKCFKLF